MLLKLAALQMCVFIFFSILEQCRPARKYSLPQTFRRWWLVVCIFGVLWLRCVLYLWPDIMIDGFRFTSNPWLNGIIFYVFIYSLCNYWVHRWKHRNKILWRFFHRLHHSPPHMQTHLAFYRHPLEIIFNTFVFVFLGKAFGLSFEAVCVALVLEGCLESFHHSNISIPKKLRKIGYIIQLPDMHLVHHQYGLHSFNYGPFLWDWVFGTLKFAPDWNERLGFASSNDVKSHITLKSS